MADDKGTIEKVRTTDVLRIVLENHDKLMKFLFETYKYPLVAKLALDLVQSAHLSHITNYLAEPDAEARMNALGAQIATALLMDRAAILQSLKDGTYVEVWQPKIYAKIAEIRASAGLPSPNIIRAEDAAPAEDSLSAWIRERKKAVESKD